MDLLLLYDYLTKDVQSTARPTSQRRYSIELLTELRELESFFLTYNISRYRLAKIMQVHPSAPYVWFRGDIPPDRLQQLYTLKRYIEEFIST